MVKLVTGILAAGTLLIQTSVVLLLLVFLLNRQFFKKIRTLLLTTNYYLLTTLALTATIGSLYFSEIAKYPICKLCWYQRILMYPQFILLAVALLKKEKTLHSYLLTLNLLGIVVAAYHYILQWMPQPPLLTCGPDGSCATSLFRYYGYITIPMMALTAFLANTLILLLTRKK